MPGHFAQPRQRVCPVHSLLSHGLPHAVIHVRVVRANNRHPEARPIHPLRRARLSGKDAPAERIHQEAGHRHSEHRRAHREGHLKFPRKTGPTGRLPGAVQQHDEREIGPNLMSFQ